MIRVGTMSPGERYGAESFRLWRQSARSRRIASEMVKMSEAGFAGTTVSFVNFKDELPYFIETVLPLLREAGLRET